MKRTPLKRGPWRRKGKARTKSSYRRRERHVPFMLWVKQQPCITRTMGVELLRPLLSTDAYMDWKRCAGDIEADHAGPRALGRKAHDSTCIPICTKHHDMRTNGYGLFWGYTLAMKRAWKTAAIEHTQARAREQGVIIPEQKAP
jgi:hypothetical protein